MRRVIHWSLAALALGCAKAEGPAQDVEAPPPPPPAGTAGTWQITALNEAGDSLLSYRMVATGDTAGWTLHLPGRDPTPMRVVSLAGDSMVVEAGPYESVLRAGLQVTTRTAFQIRGDSLFGTTTARYRTANADSVATLRMIGVRVAAP